MPHNDGSGEPEVALIVGGGPGVSASCARLFATEGMRVAVAARSPGKEALQELANDHGVRCYGCDAGAPDAVAELFRAVEDDLGPPRFVVHNIDGRTNEILRKPLVDARSRSRRRRAAQLGIQRFPRCPASRPGQNW